ncbi:unnamed protein product, partial [marine sediment metagenome]
IESPYIAIKSHHNKNIEKISHRKGKHLRCR